jgi:integrase
MKMPKVSKRPHLKLHHNTWIVRYQVPKDCQHFFGRREIVKSTGYKEPEIVDAELVRDVEVAKIKQRIRDFRRGKINNEPSLIESRDEAIKDYVEKSDAIRIARRSDNEDDEHTYQRVQGDNLLEYEDILIDRLIPDGVKGITKIASETANPDRDDILKTHYPEIYKQIREQLEIVRGKGFLSRLDSFLKIRDMKLKGKKYQSEHESKIKAFAAVFPIIQGVTHREVKLWTRELEVQGLASATINKRLGMLNNYWRFLQEEELAPAGASPFVGQSIKRFKKFNRKIFSIEDARRLIEEKTYQTDRYPYLIDFIQLGFLTGCRIKELCELKKENIITYDNERVINITEEMTKRHTRGARKIPLTNKIAPIIDKRISETTDGYLFKGVRDKHDDRTAHMCRRFSTHKHKLGFAKNLEVAHSFRHTANTILSKQENNVPKEHREVLFGWSDGTDKSMATTGYDHFDESYPMSQRRRDLEKLGNEFWYIAAQRRTPRRPSKDKKQIDLEDLIN